MSLLKWKELVKRKTELGEKSVGRKNKPGIFSEGVQTKNTKLDDVAFGNLKLTALQRKRGKKMALPDYGIPTYDEDIPDYALDDLFDEEEIRPEQNKHLVPKPPTYENH